MTDLHDTQIPAIRNAKSLRLSLIREEEDSNLFKFIFAGVVLVFVVAGIIVFFS